MEYVCRLYANTTPFYIRALSICGFWYPQGILKPIPLGYPGTTVQDIEKIVAIRLYLSLYMYSAKLLCL